MISGARTTSNVPAVMLARSGSGRRRQPYRKGPRTPGPALDAMLRGRTLDGYNPKDVERRAAKLTTARASGVQLPDVMKKRKRGTARRPVIRGSNTSYQRWWRRHHGGIA